MKIMEVVLSVIYVSLTSLVETCHTDGITAEEMEILLKKTTSKHGGGFEFALTGEQGK